jgi:hypothetical protein
VQTATRSIGIIMPETTVIKGKTVTITGGRMQTATPTGETIGTIVTVTKMTDVAKTKTMIDDERTEMLDDEMIETTIDDETRETMIDDERTEIDDQMTEMMTDDEKTEMTEEIIGEMIKMMTGEGNTGIIGTEGTGITMNSGENSEIGEIAIEMMLDDRTAIATMIVAEKTETKIKGVIIEIGVIAMMTCDENSVIGGVRNVTMIGAETIATLMPIEEDRIGNVKIATTIKDAIGTMIVEEMLETMTGGLTIETGAIEMMTYEGNSEIEETDGIVTILIDETGIVTPMWTGDVKIEIGETVMIAMMTCEENLETEGIETEMMTEEETEILMVTDDVKIETGEIVTTAMMTYGEN